jgi:hypothetical protein
VKYDDVSWHTGADEYPRHLPPEAAATHTGMFLAWAMLSGLGGDVFDAGDHERLKKRAVTPGRFFLDSDGKLVDEMLSDEGNRFAQAYFDMEKGTYLHDYDRVLCAGVETAYEVPDTWQNFDRLKPMLDRRLDEWRRGVLGRKPWWKFW